MYDASAGFHEAVANGAPQMAMLLFDDAVFTNEDIDVEGGIEMDEYFSTEEDLSIGQVLSSELRFSLFNDDHTLNNYAFGEFNAYIGACVAESSKNISSRYIRAYGPNGTTNWYAYFTGMGSQYDIYTSSTLKAGTTTYMVERMVWVIDRNGYEKVYAVGNNINSFTAYNAARTPETVTLTSMQKAKILSLPPGGYYLDVSNNAPIGATTVNKVFQKYEFVPLGRFIAKRPNVPDTNLLQFTCYDQMTKFDADMPTAAELGITYPVTFGALFVALCDYVDVGYDPNLFINSTAQITKEPKEFESVTMRQVLQWIAEAAGSNLRFTRDGKLKFDWIRSTETVLTESDYSEYNPYWYTTPVIDKLYNRDTQSGTDITVGTGENGYLIQDNPLLKGVS